MIRLYQIPYMIRNDIETMQHTSQAGSPLIATHHVNERKQSRSTSLCGAREGVNN